MADETSSFPGPTAIAFPPQCCLLYRSMNMVAVTCITGACETIPAAGRSQAALYKSVSLLSNSAQCAPSGKIAAAGSEKSTAYRHPYSIILGSGFT